MPRPDCPVWANVGGRSFASGARFAGPTVHSRSSPWPPGSLCVPCTLPDSARNEYSHALSRDKNCHRSGPSQGLDLGRTLRFELARTAPIWPELIPSAAKTRCLQVVETVADCGHDKVLWAGGPGGICAGARLRLAEFTQTGSDRRAWIRFVTSIRTKRRELPTGFGRESQARSTNRSLSAATPTAAGNPRILISLLGAIRTTDRDVARDLSCRPAAG